MAPTSTIILCRHAQAEHNVEYDYTIHDAALTRLGKQQAASIRPATEELQAGVDLICTSPLIRTLQTTKLGWSSAITRLGINNVICLPQAQECNGFPCDTGSSKDVLESLPEFKGFNFELLNPEWTSKEGFYSPDSESLKSRARWVRQFLRDRPEQNIVLVAHGDILRQITATSEGRGRYRWFNAEEENKAVVGGYGPNSSDMIVEGL